jgi:hypothetical protein
MAPSLYRASRTPGKKSRAGYKEVTINPHIANADPSSQTDQSQAHFALNVPVFR